MSNKVALRYGAKWRSEDVKRESDVTFKSFSLSEKVTRGLHLAGFRKPTPIQLKAIPLGRCGLDLIIQAKSGTGKTCVFTVVALESLTGTKALQVLILAPTREIAHQNWSVLKAIGQEISDLHSHVFIGGTPIAEDTKKVKNCQIAVGTPGRIKQLIEMQCLLPGCVRLLVLDEADKLISDRFTEDINWIYNHLPVRKQVLAASATFTDTLKAQVENYMRFPRMVAVDENDLALKGVLQFYTVVEDHHMSHIVFQRKKEVVKKIFSRISFAQCIIFCNWITRVEMLYNWLKEEDYPVAKISSNDDQTARLDTMDQLKKFNCKIVVSSDLTARGIDAENVDLVIQLDLAQYLDTYLHRVGRAGRFGAKAICISLVTTGFEEQKLSTFGEEGSFDVYLLPDPIPQNLFSWTFDILRSSGIKTCKGSFNESQEKAITKVESKTVDEIAAAESSASSDSELENELDIENGNVALSDSFKNGNVTPPDSVKNGSVTPLDSVENGNLAAPDSVENANVAPPDSIEIANVATPDSVENASAIPPDFMLPDSAEKIINPVQESPLVRNSDVLSPEAADGVGIGVSLGEGASGSTSPYLTPEETTSHDNSRASAFEGDAECLDTDSREEMHKDISLVSVKLVNADSPFNDSLSNSVNVVCANNNNVLINGKADGEFMPVFEDCAIEVANSCKFHDPSPNVLPESVESDDISCPSTVAVARDSSNSGNSLLDVIGTFLLSHSSGSSKPSPGSECPNSEVITKSFDCFYENFDCSVIGKTYEEMVENFENPRSNLLFKEDKQARQEYDEKELKVLETYLCENKNLFLEGIRETAETVLQSLENPETRDLERQTVEVKEPSESAENIVGSSKQNCLRNSEADVVEDFEKDLVKFNKLSEIQNMPNNSASFEQIVASKPEENFTNVSNSAYNSCQKNALSSVSFVLENEDKVGDDTSIVMQGHSSIIHKAGKFNCDNNITKQENVKKGNDKSVDDNASRAKESEGMRKIIKTCEPLQSKLILPKKRYDKSKSISETSTPLTQIPADSKCLVTKAHPVPRIINGQFKNKKHSTKAGQICTDIRSFPPDSTVSDPNILKLDQQKTKKEFQGKHMKNKYVFKRSKFQKNKTGAKENNYESFDCERQNCEVHEPMQYDSNSCSMSSENKIEKGMKKNGYNSSYKKNGHKHGKTNDFSRCNTHRKEYKTWNNEDSEEFSLGDVGLQSHQRSCKNRVKTRAFPSYLSSHHFHSRIQQNQETNYHMSYDGLIYPPLCERQFQFYWPSHVSLPRNFTSCSTAGFCSHSENCSKNSLQYSCYSCGSLIGIHPFDLHVFCCECAHGETREDHGLHPCPDDPGYALFEEYMQSLVSRKSKKSYC